MNPPNAQEGAIREELEIVRELLSILVMLGVAGLLYLVARGAA